MQNNQHPLAERERKREKERERGKNIGMQYPHALLQSFV